MEALPSCNSTTISQQRGNPRHAGTCALDIHAQELSPLSDLSCWLAPFLMAVSRDQGDQVVLATSTVESVIGTKQTSGSTLNMSAFGSKADISDRLADVRIYRQCSQGRGLGSILWNSVIKL